MLHGLNYEYDPNRVLILGKEKLPPLLEAPYNERGEEIREVIMLNDRVFNTNFATEIRKRVFKGSNIGRKSPTKGNHG